MIGSRLSTDLPPELALVVACCRWPPSPPRNDSVRAAASQPIDWGALERVVERHRVTALVHNGFGSAKVEAPPAVRRRLAESAVIAGRTGLAQARETLRLQDIFDEAGLPNVSIKGSSLALLAYGTLGMKQSWDIDLLITPEHATAGRRLLVKLGYEMVQPAAFEHQRFARFIRSSVEAVFFNSALNLWAELHWRLTANAVLLPGITARSRTQLVPLGSRELRTLNNDALFAYLCAHGARHGWARLKWLADLNAFLACRSMTDIERLYRNAVSLEVGRPAAAALLLCRKLFGTALPDDLISALPTDPFVRTLITSSLNCMTYRRGEAEFSICTMAKMRLILSHFLFSSGHRHFCSEMRAKWISLMRRLSRC